MLPHVVATERFIFLWHKQLKCARKWTDNSHRLRAMMAAVSYNPGQIDINGTALSWFRLLYVTLYT